MVKKDLGSTDIGMQANLAALLCYVLGFITGLIFFLIEKKNKFVRFHAMQSILFSASIVILNIVFGFIPVLNLILIPLVSLAAMVLWIVLLIKAYQGEEFKLPIIGDIAEKNSKVEKSA